jgi:hypothetical protein
VTSHELARYLLAETPDLPIFINGWGSDEGTKYEVTGAAIDEDRQLILGHGIYGSSNPKTNKYEHRYRDWGMSIDRLGNERITEYRSKT